MGKDTPDWGGQYVGPDRYPLTDVGELAVRLGSPVTYDRRGAVLWSETFEYGLAHLNDYTLGTGSTQQLVDNPVFQPPFGAYLLAGTTVPSSSGFVERFSPTFSGRVGLACLFFPGNNAQRFDLRIYRHYPTFSFDFKLSVDNVAHTLAYLGADNLLHTIESGLTDYHAGGGFVSIKLVVDMDAGRYVRGVLNGEEYDLSALPAHTTTAAYTANWEVDVLHYNTSGVARGLYIDNIVVTTNEP